MVLYDLKDTFSLSDVAVSNRMEIRMIKNRGAEFAAFELWDISNPALLILHI